MARTDMDAIEIADFLRSQRTGVLCLARDDDSYGVPLSFVYRDDDSGIYFRMGYAPGSQKRKFLDATDHATFVVYGQTDEGWRSVVAEGTLDVLTEDNVDSAVEEATKALDIPYYEVHDRPVEDLEFNIVRLQISHLSGIVEGHEGR
ncbi:pyridoxamine 5'-phosphate oxidase family protein [Halomicroarcula limicola]|uniref:Pyridoxamine 5'-phosphate oxidase family protein n=1 Tax=Haloarcula limicola TaxID=1429915 RepID=A0A8J7Y9L0_9EURY|nr:pyridoxamine 5'-phosphate oxidase family protein [Halomicroarcula limicola]MBV0924586.1 pyridoxamine 5'-phosphate oxidase family protein [Halomicroarcula limicola]